MGANIKQKYCIFHKSTKRCLGSAEILEGWEDIVFNNSEVDWIGDCDWSDPEEEIDVKSDGDNCGVNEENNISMGSGVSVVYKIYCFVLSVFSLILSNK